MASRSSRFQSLSKTRQVFVLRVPGTASKAEVEHVNAGQTSQHATLAEAYAHITAIISNVPPSNSSEALH